MNLEINNYQKTLIKIKDNSLFCSGNFSHELHSSNAQLNTLVDLVINLGENLKISHSNLETLAKGKTKNLDYIKDQNTVILDKIAKLENINNLISELNRLNQELKKISIDSYR